MSVNDAVSEVTGRDFELDNSIPASENDALSSYTY